MKGKQELKIPTPRHLLSTPTAAISRSSTAMTPNSPTGAAAAVNNKYKLHGMMFKYLEPLAIALEKEHWSLVQFLFSSSYNGYGDANELDQLISYLIDNEDSHGVILLGHSHGCQAPISDREHFQETGSMIDLAATMINQGRPHDFMPRKAHPHAPITAYRYHSLCTRNGEDDMFSSDLSDEELKEKLGHILCRALGGAEMVEIESGNHSLSDWIKEAVQAIMEFVKRDGLKGCEDPWS
ncbi:hypothetical protein SASPL_100391 [Salvia splendens]|uniref:Uncharacterized protein n=1 Tax=Salvia splendens TaxID=180675 RepID=A0A8X8YS08_SALSN|nr:hypothetical protein SASPL_100391 [Salvia splendens]